jgi:hypothetical protein
MVCRFATDVAWERLLKGDVDFESTFPTDNATSIRIFKLAIPLADQAAILRRNGYKASVTNH